MIQPATPPSHFLSDSGQLGGFCVSVLMSWSFESPSVLCPATSFLSLLPPVPSPGTSFLNSFGLDLSPCAIHPSPLSGHQPLPGISVPHWHSPTVFIQHFSFTKVLLNTLAHLTFRVT